MKRMLINVVLISALGLVGCSTNNTRNENTGIGAVTGAAVGGVGAGLLGGNAVAVGAGIVGGALIGGLMGHSMDSSDSMQGNTAVADNSTNQTSSWYNPNKRIKYTMTPTSGRFTVNGNPNCRNFHFTSTRAGKMHDYDGTACLMSDGYWHSIKR